MLQKQIIKKTETRTVILCLVGYFSQSYGFLDEYIKGIFMQHYI
jgi:hypothetical protein